MLVDRHQLEMREAHVDGVGDERVGELVVGEPAVAVAAPPRAEMHLVDRHRRAARVALRARGHPRRRRSRRSASVSRTTDAVDGRSSAPKPTGSALSGSSVAVGADDLVLVDRALADAGDEDLPDAGVDALAHRVAAAVPGVEVADDRDAPRVRRPDGEVHARARLRARSHARRAGRRAARACPRRAASRPSGPAPARRRTDRRPSTLPPSLRGAQPVARAPRQRRPRRSRRRAGARACASSAPSRVTASTASRAGHEGAHDQRRRRLVQAEHRERVAVAARDDGRDRRRADARARAPLMASLTPPVAPARAQMSRAYSRDRAVRRRTSPCARC